MGCAVMGPRKQEAATVSEEGRKSQGGLVFPRAGAVRSWRILAGIWVCRGRAGEEGVGAAAEAWEAEGSRTD